MIGAALVPPAPMGKRAKSGHHEISLGLNLEGQQQPSRAWQPPLAAPRLVP